jgi:hypothetical protein
MRPAAALGLLTALLLATLLTGGCAVAPPAPGTPRAALQGVWGVPTAEHAMPDGGQRLEYASGPYGRTTWMVDLDATGRVQQARQVLNEAEFQDVMSTPNLRRGEVLRRLGAPGEVRGYGWRREDRGNQIWSWRYPTNDCLWFELTLAADGRVTGGGYGTDPACDRRSDSD